MQSYILIFFTCLLFTPIFAQTSHEYWMETTSLDSLILSKGTSKKVIRGKNENTQFDFSVNTAKGYYLKPFCSKCRDSLGISIKLLGKRENAYTRWIYLNKGDSISISDCFKNYPEKNWWQKKEKTKSAKEKALDFWKSILGGGRVAVKRTPALKGGDEPLPEEPKLSFGETDYCRYLKQSDFILPFKIFKKYPVKSIYIISHKGEMIFCSGDPSLVKEVFPALKAEQVPPLNKVLKEVLSKKDNEIAYKLSMDKISPYLLKDLISGQWYQLGIELQDDTSDYNPYLFNFQFFTQDEVDKLMSFPNE